MLRLVLLLCCTGSLSACYYMQAAAGQWEVLRKREPVDEVIADVDTPPELVARLQLVNEARDFSIDVLRLPDNNSYRTYTDLERDNVLWNVFAAPEFSLQPEQWCFPVAGCVSYRGYFSKERAIRESQRLAKKGRDVAVGGVAAYSTLGKFSDPVLNTMMHWDDVRLVAVLFHELAHQVVYVKGDSGFNESFATAVEEFGVSKWLTSRGQTEEIARYRDGRELRQRLMTLVTIARNDLGEVFSSKINDEQKRELKKQRLQELSEQVAAELERSGRAPDSWLSGELNNARLISMTLYEGLLPSFRALFDRCDQDIQCFYNATSDLAELDSDERNRQLDELIRG